MSTHFKIIVPSWNAMPWLPQCLVSIKYQRYASYDVVVIDDASTIPGETKFVKDFCSDAGWKYQLNESNMRCPYNLKLGTNLLNPNPEDVILIVDGDDWLPDTSTLSTLAYYFEDPDIWLTYGSYKRWPDPNYMPNPATEYPQEVLQSRSFRQYSVSPFNHPLVFRSFLWNEVRDEDLQHENGEWFQAGYDEAIMHPMLEMATGHFRFLPEVLYIYNEGNNLSDWRTKPAICNQVWDEVRGRPKKDLLVRKPVKKGS